MSTALLALSDQHDGRVLAWHRVWDLARRELSLEAAGREAAVSVLPFSGSVILLAGLAFGPRPAVLAATAPGTLWLAVLLSAVPMTHRVAAAERSEGSWDVLRCLCSPTELLAGKAAAVWLGLAATWGVSAGLITVLFAAPLPSAAFPGAILGTLTLAVLTVVFGTITAGGTRRQGLLAVLLLPAALPVLLAGTQTATSGLDARPWLALLTASAVVALVAAWAVYPAVREDS